MSAEPFKHGHSGMDGILRIRRAGDDTVVRLHVVGPWMEDAMAAAGALASGG